MSRSSLCSCRAPAREEDGTGISSASDCAGMGSTSPRCTEQAGVGAQPFCSKLSYFRFPLSAVIFVPLLHVNSSFLVPFLAEIPAFNAHKQQILSFCPAHMGCKTTQKGKRGGEERAACHVPSFSIIAVIMAQRSPEWQPG